MKSLLIIGAASVAFGVYAAEPLPSPRATVIQHPVVSSTVKDPNLLAGYPRPGSRTLDAAPGMTTSTTKDPNLLVAARNCTMPPKAIDTEACKKMCEVAGNK